MARLLVIGAGSYGRAVAEAALLCGEHELLGCVDDRWPGLGACVGGGAVLAPLSWLQAGQSLQAGQHLDPEPPRTRPPV